MDKPLLSLLYGRYLDIDELGTILVVDSSGCIKFEFNHIDNKYQIAIIYALIVIIEECRYTIDILKI